MYSAELATVVQSMTAVVAVNVTLLICVRTAALPLFAIENGATLSMRDSASIGSCPSSSENVDMAPRPTPSESPSWRVNHPMDRLASSAVTG